MRKPLMLLHSWLSVDAVTVLTCHLFRPLIPAWGSSLLGPLLLPARALGLAAALMLALRRTVGRFPRTFGLTHRTARPFVVGVRSLFPPSMHRRSAPPTRLRRRVSGFALRTERAMLRHRVPACRADQKKETPLPLCQKKNLEACMCITYYIYIYICDWPHGCFKAGAGPPLRWWDAA